MMLTMMAPLHPDDRRESAEKIARAIRRAALLENIDAKTAEDLLALDHGQYQRQLSTKEDFQLTRAGVAAKKRASFFGHFVVCLLDEFGGWSEVLEHGAGRIVRALLSGPGQARMARMALHNPRSREDHECGTEPWQVSA